MALDLQIVSDELDSLEQKIKENKTSILALLKNPSIKRQNSYSRFYLTSIKDENLTFTSQFNALKKYLNTISKFK